MAVRTKQIRTLTFPLRMLGWLSARLSWGLLILCVFYLYLGYHALSGNQGLLKWADYEDTIASLETEIADIQAQRTALERTAAQLRPEHLDLDRLEVTPTSQYKY